MKLLFNDYRKHHFRQLAVLVACFLDTVNVGILLGFSATLLPQLDDPNTSLKVTTSESTWIASLLLLGTVPGSMIGSYLVDKIGKKRTYLLVSSVHLIGWILLASSESVEQMLIARLTSGLAMGIGFPVSFIFIVEISSPQNRGSFINTLNVAGMVGVQIVDLIGTYVKWNHAAYIYSLIPMTFMVIFFFLKDSYAWNLNRQDSTTALEKFKYFRGDSVEVLREFSEIEEDFKNRPSYSTKELILACAGKQFLKPCGIIGVFIVMVNFCGGFGIVFYSITIMKQVTDIDEYLGTAILDAVRTSATIFSIFLIGKLYRRTLTNIGGILCVISLVALSVFLYLFEVNADESGGSNIYGVVTLACMLIYTFVYFSTLVPMCTVTMGELLAGPTRYLGMGIVTNMHYGFNFLTVQFLPPMFEVLGPATVFGIFAGCSFIGSCILYFVLPETKNKSCIEIEEYFK